MKRCPILYLKGILFAVTFATLFWLLSLSFLNNGNSSTENFTNIERFWMEADTKDGFLEVKKILGDPKTTTIPSTFYKYKELEMSD